MKSVLAIDQTLRGNITIALQQCTDLNTSLAKHLDPSVTYPDSDTETVSSCPVTPISSNYAELCAYFPNEEDSSSSGDESPQRSNIRDRVKVPVALQMSQLQEEERDPNDPFYVADLGVVTRQYNLWKNLLPRIDPWYAVKCNPTPEIVSTLVGMGGGLDCASRGEMCLALEMGVAPERIIYANPCKPINHLIFARNKGITLMTFDNEDELLKIKQHHPTARLVLRILVDDSKSICRFGVKFGAPLAAVAGLLETAKALELEVVGVSFHVGSGCTDVSAFRDAVVRARAVFDAGQAMGFHFTLLDVGGGFPGADGSAYTGDIRFTDIARVLGAAVDELFPDPALQIIAEPGRYFVSSALTLMVQVTSRRVVRAAAEDPRYMYYINDGVYGAFNCIIFDHYVVSPRVLTRNGTPYTARDDVAGGAQRFSSSLWGPTCDSMDCVMREVMLPELQVGDWLCFPNMGAYTNAAASDFNGFQVSRKFFINSSPQGKNAVIKSAC